MTEYCYSHAQANVFAVFVNPGRIPNVVKGLFCAAGVCVANRVAAFLNDGADRIDEIDEFGSALDTPETAFGERTAIVAAREAGMQRLDGTAAAKEVRAPRRQHQEVLITRPTQRGFHRIGSRRRPVVRQPDNRQCSVQQ